MTKPYGTKIQYIKNLEAVLSARDDFKELTYHNDKQGNEYLFMHLITGDVKYFNISGLSEAEIFHIIAEIECGNQPTEFITDDSKRLEIGKRFN